MPEEFQEQDLDLQQREQPNLPSASKELQNQAKFFSNMTKMFTDEANKEAAEKIKEKEQELQRHLDKKKAEGRHELDKKQIEIQQDLKELEVKAQRQARKDAAKRAAHENLDLTKLEGTSLYAQTYNESVEKQRVMEVENDLYQKARDLREKHEADPEMFKQKYDEFIEEKMNEVPTEMQPRIKRLGMNQKRAKIPGIEKNQAQIQDEQLRNKLNTRIQGSIETINELTLNAWRPGARESAKSEIKALEAKLAQHSSAGEVQIGNRTYSGGNGPLSPTEVNNLVNRVKKKAARNLIVSKYKNTKDKEGFIRKLAGQPDKEGFQESKLEADLEASLNMARLTGETRDKIISDLRSRQKNQNKITNSQEQDLFETADNLSTKLSKGWEIEDSVYNETIKSLRKVDTKTAEEKIDKLVDARAVQPVRREMWGYTNYQDFDNKINVLQNELKKTDSDSERAQTLQKKIEAVEAQQTKFEKAQNNKSMMAYAKEYNNRWVENAPRDEKEEMVENTPGVSSVEELNERMRIEEIPIGFQRNEEGNITGLSEETAKALQDRVQDTKFIMSQYNAKTNMNVFTEKEVERINNMLARSNTAGKLQFRSMISDEIKEVNVDGSQDAAYQALNELADSEASKDAVIQASAIDNTETGKNIIAGGEIRAQSENDFIPSRSEVDLMMNNYIADTYDTVMPDQRSRLMTAAKNLMANRIAENGISLTNFDTTEINSVNDVVVDGMTVKDFMSKAAGRKANGKGGFGTVFQKEVTLPPNLDSQATQRTLRFIGQDHSNTQYNSGTMEAKLSGQDGTKPLRYLSLDGQNPMWDDGKKFTKEHLQNEIESENLKLVSTPRSGVYKVKAGAAGVTLMNQDGTAYRMDLRQIKSAPESGVTSSAVKSKQEEPGYLESTYNWIMGDEEKAKQAASIAKNTNKNQIPEEGPVKPKKIDISNMQEGPVDMDAVEASKESGEVKVTENMKLNTSKDQRDKEDETDTQATDTTKEDTGPRTQSEFTVDVLQAAGNKIAAVPGIVGEEVAEKYEEFAKQVKKENRKGDLEKARRQYIKHRVRGKSVKEAINKAKGVDDALEAIDNLDKKTLADVLENEYVGYAQRHAREHNELMNITPEEGYDEE